MNKAALCDVIQSVTNGTKSGAEEIMESMLDAITKTLRRGDEVSIAGLGAFSTKIRKARTARNPKTGEKVEVAATRVVKFRVAKALKDIVAAK
jgi:DNA-binding protein HU-beta